LRDRRKLMFALALTSIQKLLVYSYPNFCIPERLPLEGFHSLQEALGIHVYILCCEQNH
jgi:hypothetical protein